MSRLLLFFMVLLSFTSTGQKRYKINFQNNSYQQFIKRPKTEFKDSVSLVRYTMILRNSAISKGYILASVDELSFNHKTATLNFYLGEKFEKCDLKIDEEELKFIKKHEKINEKLISQIAFTPGEVNDLLQKIMNVYLNNGYPFARIKLKNTKIEGSNLKAQIVIKRGPYYTWTKINVRGDSSISPKFISNLLGIKLGSYYTESIRNNVSPRIEQIAYLKEIKPSEILFTKDGAELFIYLESIKISSFNGIVGFQPDPTTQKLGFTGELKLKLQDVLHRGELLDVKWQSIQAQTQSLDARVNYPFLLNTPFGLDGTFDLYKRDTSFLELNTAIGIQYFLKRGSYLKAFYRNTNSSVLSGGLNNPLFSKLGNTKTNSYGLSFSSNKLDYLPNPTRGLSLLIEGNVGLRKSQINDTTLEASSVVYKSKLRINYFIPLYKRHVLHLSNLTEFYSADEIFENEVFRYGGLSNQRGFNEDELFATTKSTTSIEYRFLLDKNSYVFAFYDQTWYENNSNIYYQDTPLGFGLGFAFSTNFGVFSISYALGKQQNNPILFSNSKVHFGYNVYF
ncbi:MAG: hypothetical protein MK105_06385 [Crocinitomicaceae bacterium]|nr:hypothetical protein [Crocinitomicaceae bacterium]